jgi:glutaredoxin 2
LKDFESKNWPIMRTLLHARFLEVPLPDLATKSARDYFANRHPIPLPGDSTDDRPSQQIWDSLDEADRKSAYKNHLQSNAPKIAKLNAVLPELENLIHSEDSVSPGGVGYDDVVFFCRMRYITLVKGIKLGAKTTAYLERMSERSDIPLLSKMAL